MSEVKITASKNGLYLISGVVELKDAVRMGPGAPRFGEERRKAVRQSGTTRKTQAAQFPSIELRLGG